MLLDSFEHAEEDLKARQLAEERVEAERILAALEQALAADGELLDADERARDRRSDARARGGGRAATTTARIRARIEALDLATKPFAERRMNRAHRARHRRARRSTRSKRRSSTPRAREHDGCAHGEGADAEGHVRTRRQSRSRCRAGTSILEAAEEGARAGRLRLRRRLRLLDLPRLREEGLRLAVRAAGERGGHPRKAFDVRPTSRLGCQSKIADEDVVVEITRESRQAWLDEHPEERAKLKQEGG